MNSPAIGAENGIYNRQEIAVLYMDQLNIWVFSVHALYEEMILRVHYDHEWISGMYVAGHACPFRDFKTAWSRKSLTLT
jgi:hypothetical protein